MLKIPLLALPRTLFSLASWDKQAVGHECPVELVNG